MRRYFRLALSAVAAFAACDGGEPALRTIDDAPEWRLAPQARISIGVVEGDERYSFHRINGITRTREGSLLVTDAGREPILTLFDSSGKFLKRVGRKGSGPGEYLYLMGPFTYRRDSLAVWDFGQRRILVYAAAGELARTVAVVVPPSPGVAGAQPSQSCCRVVHALTDGSFVLEYPSMIPKNPGPVRNATLTLARLTPDGTPADTIGTFPDRQYRYDASVRYLTPELHLSWPFVYTVVGDTIFGGNGAGRFLHRQVIGSRPDTIRLAGTSQPVTDSIRALYAQAYRDEYKRRPQFFEGRLEDAFEGEYAALVPAYTQVRSDNAGRLWLAQWAPPFSEAPIAFHVYTTRGEPVARIHLPARTWVMHLDANSVALVEYDADDVQYVRVYDIVRSPR